MYIADILSRAYLDETCPDSGTFSSRDHDQIHAVTTGILSKESFRQVFIQATLDDPSLSILKSYIADGWPTKKQSCIDPLKPYWSVRHDLSVHDDLVLKNSQLVVPVALRQRMIKDIHIGHLGVTKCVERAKNAVYWPGYVGQITDMVGSCETCQQNARSNAKTLLEQYEVPEYPMQTVSMDIFQLEGVEYLVTVDRYSKWPSCYELRSSTSKEIIEVLSRQFLDFGQPETLVSDNASYFTSREFKSFIESHDIQHITTSPHYSQSNGLAERMNQTVKSSLAKCKQTGQSLFEVISSLRSTPIGNDLPAPSVLLQGRNLRSSLNFMPSQLKMQSVDNDHVVRVLEQRQGVAQFNNTAQTQSKVFTAGMLVYVKLGPRKWVEGHILRPAETPRSFYVKLTDGRVYRRNQSFLRTRRESVVSPSNQLGVGASSDENPTPPPANQNRCSSASVPSSMPGLAAGRVEPESSAPDGFSTVTRNGRVSKPPVRFGQNIYEKK